jgi:hypothetical protein
MGATKTEPRTATTLSQRIPKGRRELAAYDRAREYGTSLGVSFPNIHAPIDDQRTVLARHAVPYAQALAKWVGVEVQGVGVGSIGDCSA